MITVKPILSLSLPFNEGDGILEDWLMNRVQNGLAKLDYKLNNTES